MSILVLAKNLLNAPIVQTSLRILRADTSTLPVYTQTSQRKNEEKLLLFKSQSRQSRMKRASEVYRGFLSTFHHWQAAEFLP